MEKFGDSDLCLNQEESVVVTRKSRFIGELTIEKGILTAGAASGREINCCGRKPFPQ